jgi:hypothetical protein
MININRLSLDTRIYPIEIVQRAISDYKGIAKITFTYIKNTSKLALNFNDIKPDFELIKNEFCNYLIQLHAVMGEGSEQLF